MFKIKKNKKLSETLHALHQYHVIPRPIHTVHYLGEPREPSVGFVGETEPSPDHSQTVQTSSETAEE